MTDSNRKRIVAIVHGATGLIWAVAGAFQGELSMRILMACVGVGYGFVAGYWESFAVSLSCALPRRHPTLSGHPAYEAYLRAPIDHEPVSDEERAALEEVKHGVFSTKSPLEEQ